MGIDFQSAIVHNTDIPLRLRYGSPHADQCKAAANAPNDDVAPPKTAKTSSLALRIRRMMKPKAAVAPLPVVVRMRDNIAETAAQLRAHETAERTFTSLADTTASQAKAVKNARTRMQAGDPWAQFDLHDIEPPANANFQKLEARSHALENRARNIASNVLDHYDQLDRSEYTLNELAAKSPDLAKEYKPQIKKIQALRITLDKLAAKLLQF